MVIPSEKNKGFYDRFRNRIIFPIFDIRDKIIGFGARALGTNQPKYINSPETIIYSKGKHLYGEMETTSTPNGGILLGLLRDRTGVGFSMRGLAELERKQDYNEVKGPLTIIAFDAVSMPSHESAVVDFNEMKFESSMLTESASGMICANGRCFMPDYFDKLVEKKVINFFDRWV